MIRVDHAGEFGALQIYAGQLAVLSRDPRAREAVAAIRHMAAQESTHFEAFDALMRIAKCGRPRSNRCGTSRDSRWARRPR